MIRQQISCLLYTSTHAQGVRENKENSLFFHTNIYLFFKLDMGPFNVVPIRYNALIPTFFPVHKTLVKFFFWYSLQFIQ